MIKNYNLFVREDGFVRKSKGYFDFERDNLVDFRSLVNSVDDVLVKPLYHFIVNNKQILYLKYSNNPKNREILLLISKIPTSTIYLDSREFVGLVESRKLSNFKKVVDCYVEKKYKH